jgi:hypothetical protein
MNALVEGVFELGKVLLKVELSKFETKDLLRAQRGAAGEAIVLQKIGKFWNQQNMWDRPDGLVVVTTHRLAFLAKEQAITATTEFLSFPFASMANLKAARVMGISPAVQFEIGGKPYVFTLLSGANEVVAAIQQYRAAA